MGMEDFGVILRPTQALSVAVVEYELRGKGFAINQSVPIVFSNEVTYTLQDNAKNIEALLKQDAADTTSVKYISIRYAICQPAIATQAFLEIVSQLVCKFPLQVEGSGKGFSKDTLDDFRELVAEKVLKAKSRWRDLFEGDNEEIVLPVADTWKHFLAKHPGVLRNSTK